MTQVNYALRKSDFRGVELVETALPVCRGDDVVIAPRYVGLCGTDLNILRGGRSDSAQILGHEGVAEVVQAGDNVRILSVGDWVVLNPVNRTNQDEVLGHSFDGLFQSRMKIENIEQRQWMYELIPEVLRSRVGALIEPLATAVYSYELIGKPDRDSNVVIFGDGPVALLNLVLLWLRGVTNITLVHGSSMRVDFAKSLGIESTRYVNYSSSNLTENIVESLYGCPADVTLICTGPNSVEKCVSVSLKYTRSGGLVNLIASAMHPVISVKSGDLNVAAIRRMNVCGQVYGNGSEAFTTAEGSVVNFVGQRGTSSSHIRESIDLISRYTGVFRRFVTSRIDFRTAASFINDRVEKTVSSSREFSDMKMILVNDS